MNTLSKKAATALVIFMSFFSAVSADTITLEKIERMKKEYGSQIEEIDSYIKTIKIPSRKPLPLTRESYGYKIESKDLRKMSVLKGTPELDSKQLFRGEVHHTNMARAFFTLDKSDLGIARIKSGEGANSAEALCLVVKETEKDTVVYRITSVEKPVGQGFNVMCFDSNTKSVYLDVVSQPLTDSATGKVVIKDGKEQTLYTFMYITTVDFAKDGKGDGPRFEYKCKIVRDPSDQTKLAYILFQKNE
jgi:hypothetical protein